MNRYTMIMEQIQTYKYNEINSHNDVSDLGSKYFLT